MGLGLSGTVRLAEKVPFDVRDVLPRSYWTPVSTFSTKENLTRSESGGAVVMEIEPGGVIVSKSSS